MAKTERRVTSNRKRVLLVDDEPAVTSGIALALRFEPYEFIEVHSGPEALQVLQDEHVDVIVADESMPGMTGTQLLSRARQSHPGVIRIMLTGHVDVPTAMKAIHDGWVYQYLQKPCPPSDLAATIHNALVLRSFMLPDEGPHLRMSAQDEEKLMEKVGQPAAVPSSGYSGPPWDDG